MLFKRKFIADGTEHKLMDEIRLSDIYPYTSADERITELESMCNEAEGKEEKKSNNGIEALEQIGIRAERLFKKDLISHSIILTLITITIYLICIMSGILPKDLSNILMISACVAYLDFSIKNYRNIKTYMNYRKIECSIEKDFLIREFNLSGGEIVKLCDNEENDNINSITEKSIENNKLFKKRSVAYQEKSINAIEILTLESYTFVIITFLHVFASIAFVLKSSEIASFVDSLLSLEFNTVYQNKFLFLICLIMTAFTALPYLNYTVHNILLDESKVFIDHAVRARKKAKDTDYRRES